MAFHLEPLLVDHLKGGVHKDIKPIKSDTIRLIDKQQPGSLRCRAPGMAAQPDVYAI
jgi:hypothetical protein